MLPMPITTAPAACSRSTGKALRPGTNPANNGDPCVMRRPATQIESFTTTGTPASGKASPAAIRGRRAAASRNGAVSS